MRECWPRHDLEKITVRDIVVALARSENYRSSGNANRRASSVNVCYLRCGTGGMDVVEICTMAENLLKLCKRVTAFRSTILVRCQISGDDEWTCIPVRPGRSPNCAEVGASIQVDRRIDLRRLVKERVVARDISRLISGSTSPAGSKLLQGGWPTLAILPFRSSHPSRFSKGGMADPQLAPSWVCPAQLRLLPFRHEGPAQSQPDHSSCSCTTTTIRIHGWTQHSQRETPSGSAELPAVGPASVLPASTN